MSVVAPMMPPALQSQPSSTSVDRARPPPAALVGHENLFAYWGLTKWAREHTKVAAAAATAASPSGAGSLDALLHSKGLPLLAGDRLPDGSLVSLNPNDSLMALAFQAPGPPLPRHTGLSEPQRRGLTLTSVSRGPSTGALSLASKFAALMEQRQNAVEEAQRQAKRDKKRAKKERMGAASGLGGIAEEDATAAASASASAAAASASAAAPAASAAASAPTGAFRISLKRKADDGATTGGAELFFPSASSVATSSAAGLTPAQEGDKKKKKSKKKDDALVV